MTDLDWDAPIERPYRRYEDGVVVVTFDNDRPTTTTNDYNHQQLNFDVDGEFWFGVSSKRLMNLLKRFKPLTGKTLRIQRTGHGVDTTYQVEEVVM